MDIVVKNNQVISEQFRTHKNRNSILDEIDTGFGPEYTISSPSCHHRKGYYEHLYKENFLSEFRTEEEREIARNNLGVVGLDVILKAFSDINNIYATKSEVDKIAAGNAELTNYYTKQETKALINSELKDLLSNDKDILQLLGNSSDISSESVKQITISNEVWRLLQ